MSLSRELDILSVLKHVRPDNDAWKCRSIDPSLIRTEQQTLSHSHNAGQHKTKYLLNILYILAVSDARLTIHINNPKVVFYFSLFFQENSNIIH